MVGVRAALRYEAGVNSKILIHSFVCAVLVWFAAGCNDTSQSAPVQKNAADVLSGMRLKQLTKDLELTADQQGRLKILLDEEGKEIAKIRAQTELSITDQAIKVGELKKETYAKLAPLLDPAQLEKLQKASKTKRK